MFTFQFFYNRCRPRVQPPSNLGHPRFAPKPANFLSGECGSRECSLFLWPARPHRARRLAGGNFTAACVKWLTSPGVPQCRRTASHARSPLPVNRVAQASRLRVRAPSRCPFPELAARRRQNPQPRRLRYRNAGSWSVSKSVSPRPQPGPRQQPLWLSVRVGVLGDRSDLDKWNKLRHALCVMLVFRAKLPLQIGLFFSDQSFEGDKHHDRHRQNQQIA